PREKYFLTTVTSLLLLAITLPYIWAWLLTPKGFHFSGILFNPADQNVHCAWAHQASNGHFTLRDIFTSESLTAEARPLFVNLYASLIDVTSRLTHVRIVWVSHLYRAIFTVLAMIWFYDLCSQIIKSISTRYLALLFAAFSTGVGWLYPVF